jgi:uncharacterized protein YoxC
MKETFVIVLLIVAAIALGALTVVLMELRKTVRRMNDFLEKAEGVVIPAAEEIQQTMRHVKDITGEVSGMTKDVRQVTSAVGKVGGEIEELAGLIDTTVVKARANIGGIKAGFQTAVSVLIKNMLRKGGNSDGKSSLS